MIRKSEIFLARKILISIGLASLFLIGWGLNGLSTYPTLTSTNNNSVLFIECSNGNYYNATWLNVWAAVNATPNWGTVFLPNATFTASTEIHVNNKNITIDGQGTALIDLSANTGNAFHFQDTTTTNRRHVVLKNMRIRGDEAKTNQFFVNFTDVCGELTGLVCAYPDTLNYLVSFYGGCQGSSVHDNMDLRVHNAVLLRGTSSNRCSNGTIISDNFFNGRYISGSGLFNYGVVIEYGEGIIISGNHFGTEDWNSGVESGYCYGIVATNSHRMNINGNYICGSLEGVNLGTCKGYDVSGNNIRASLDSAKGIDFTLSSNQYGGVISGNNIWQTGSSANSKFFDLSNCRGLSMTGNNVYFSNPTGTTYGIYSSGTVSGSLICANNFYSETSGTWTGMSFNTLSKSMVTNNHIKGASTNIDISTNTSNSVTNNFFNT